MDGPNPAHFEQRRHTEPQQVIDALVEQTTRQGRAIYDLKQELEKVTALRDALQFVLDAKDIDEHVTRE